MAYAWLSLPTLCGCVNLAGAVPSTYLSYDFDSCITRTIYGSKSEYPVSSYCM